MRRRAIETPTRDTGAAANPAVDSNQAPPSSSESDCVQGTVSWYGAPTSVPGFFSVPTGDGSNEDVNINSVGLLLGYQHL